MAKAPLFSTYRQGENRVTSSMLAVFERIDLSLLETLLTATTGEANDIQMVSFVNQPPGHGASVPDALISASFAFWFEIKTTQNAVRESQLREHAKNLGTMGGYERLFVTTPDTTKPKAVEAVGDDRIIWFNFKTLSNAIDDVLDDAKSLVSEQNEFLLRELQALLAADGLLDSDDVVIVAARLAYGDYLKYSAYVCQPNRSFRQGLTHLGFYAEATIQAEIPLILMREAAIPFTPAEAKRRRTSGSEYDLRIANLIEALSVERFGEGNEYQVFLLSEPTAPITVRLTEVIRNNQRSASGQPVAWTMGQRYISLGRLIRDGMRFTSDLDRD